MTINEKLKHFYDSSLEEARLQSSKTLEEYKNSLDEEFAQFKKEVDMVEDKRLKDAEAKIRRTVNHELSANLLSTRRSLTDRHNELKAAIFDEVATLLTNYRKTPAYKADLKKYIESAMEFANGEDIIVTLDPADEKFLKELSEEYSCTFLINEVSFGGGIRAVIPSREILLEHSFDTRFQDAFNEFSFNGGNS